VRELTGCISKTETEDFESPLPHASDKSSLIAVAFINLRLPVSPAEIARGEELTTGQSVQTSMNLRRSTVADRRPGEADKTDSSSNEASQKLLFSANTKPEE